ncbi:MAG: CHC2 zinc finger domain-containing protein [Chloroflexota bacterium]|nr:CHC2 zinc finger domain-containing protein [Chloroflexota bacterium]
MSSGTSTRTCDVEGIKRRCSIADVVSARVGKLTPSGVDTYKALCPFHEDRNPSLLVDERDGHFHCFACKAHGDVIDFVQRADGLTFAEACNRLTSLTPSAPRARGCDRRHRLAGVGRRAGQCSSATCWDRLTLREQAAMNEALAVYQRVLWATPHALDYLRGRGIPDWVTRECGLGYADGHSLRAYLSRGRLGRTARGLGLIKPTTGIAKPGDSLDFLAGRIIVPELRGGQCIWMIGRLVEDSPHQPKYLALPGERPVLGWERAAGREEVFLCEGVFDYLTAVSWRLPAFSPCGTSLPNERLGFLAGTRVVWGVLDGDDAGRAAADRFAQQLGRRWKPLQLPEGYDLNDLGRQPDGAKLFAALVKRARRDSREGAKHV